MILLLLISPFIVLYIILHYIKKKVPKLRREEKKARMKKDKNDKVRWGIVPPKISVFLWKF